MTMRYAAVLACIGGIVWTWMVNGAMPHLGVPTLGQAASMMGYAQDFAHRHWYTVHAYAFGYPLPVSLATGLPLAMLAGWFLRMGLHVADAYAAAMACWLAVGFMGAFRLASCFGLRGHLAALAAAMWMTLPMVWEHQSYSSLAIGMACLPLYLSSAYSLVESVPSARATWYARVEFVALCSVALFMDGYTFMMFVLGGFVLLGVRVLQRAGDRRELMVTVLPVFVLGFACAWWLYTRYVGSSGFDPAPLDFFRAWAVDPGFVVRPTHGELWFWDLLGWGQERSESRLFGDASVWRTTFALPLVLAGIYAFISICRIDNRAWWLLLMAIGGLYLSLGPDLKLGAMKAAGVTDPLMPVGAALMPTGSSWLFAHVPGFKSTRAVYRWEALFLLGTWGLIALRAARAPQGKAWRWGLIYIVIMVALAPHLGERWGDYRSYARGFATFDSALAEPMSSVLKPNERVLFLPINNDVMVNYLAPKLGIRSYNVGGDKQNELARPAWPARLRAFATGHVDANDLPAMRRALIDDQVDAIVLPYFNSLWAAHLWPCVAQASGYSASALALFEGSHDFRCPGQIRSDEAPLIEAIGSDPWLSMTDGPLFAVVRLRPEYAGEAGRAMALARMLRGVSLPIDVASDPKADLLLDDGWYGREPVNRWSSGHARLMVPIPPEHQGGMARIKLTLAAFAASARRPVDVAIVVDHGKAAHAVFHDEVARTIVVEAPAGRAAVTVDIDIPTAASPAQLGMSVDARVLGVSLLAVDVVDEATVPKATPGA